MRTVARFLLGCFAIGALTLLGASLLGGPGVVQSKAGSTVNTVASVVPANIQSYSDSAGAFVRRNVTTAELQLGGMKNSIPTSFAFNDWLPSNAPNWIQGGAQAATRAMGNKPGQMARKVPVVSRALSSTDAHFAALRQSINNTAANF
jgi:hypothetical protein